jgi:hypothetical protein
MIRGFAILAALPIAPATAFAQPYSSDRSGNMPSHGFVTTTDRWSVVETTADAEGSLLTSRIVS